ncbi:MAG: hypothetical protein N2053_12090 [Chitinispirillaceae bacterium]|nr:hypothetical protein [Chitinispirillaceae bacterium]
MNLIILFLLIFIGCTTPPSFVDRGNIISDTKPISVAPVKGYGKISARINGEILEGSFDMIYNSDSFFHITFYTGFGTIVGFIRSNRDSGTINFGGKEKNLSLFDNLNVENTFLFINTNLLNVIKILSGKIIYELTREKPLEIKEKGDRIFYRWEKDNINYTGIFSKKTGAIKNFIIEQVSSSENKRKYIIRLKNFHENFAKFLSFYVDGQNYFYLRYENIKRIIR